MQLNTLIAALALSASSVTAIKARFYQDASCNHNAPDSRAFPATSTPPLNFGVNDCLSAPLGTDWQRVEINENIDGVSRGVITFCHINCSGTGSVIQGNTHCYKAPSGCAVASFKVINL